MLEIEIMVIRIRIKGEKSDSRHAGTGSQRTGTDVGSRLHTGDDGRIGKNGVIGAIATLGKSER